MSQSSPSENTKSRQAKHALIKNLANNIWLLEMHQTKRMFLFSQAVPIHCSLSYLTFHLKPFLANKNQNHYSATRENVIKEREYKTDVTYRT